jgi:hypothetical protein
MPWTASELFVVPRGVEHCPSSTTPSSSRSRYEDEQRVVFGRNTYQTFAQMLGSDADEARYDLRVTRMRSLHATVVSTTLDAPLDWPDATVANGDVVEVVARLKEESAVPLRSSGSLSMEPGADGRRPRRPNPADRVSRDHRSDG